MTTALPDLLTLETLPPDALRVQALLRARVTAVKVLVAERLRELTAATRRLEHAIRAARLAARRLKKTLRRPPSPRSSPSSLGGFTLLRKTSHLRGQRCAGSRLRRSGLAAQDHAACQANMAWSSLG